MPSYESVMEWTTSCDNHPDPGDIEVRVRTGESWMERAGKQRKTFQYYVVEHGTEEVLFESRTALQYRENPSPTEVSARARGFRQGYRAAQSE